MTAEKNRHRQKSVQINVVPIRIYFTPVGFALKDSVVSRSIFIAYSSGTVLQMAGSGSNMRTIDLKKPILTLTIYANKYIVLAFEDTKDPTKSVIALYSLNGRFRKQKEIQINGLVRYMTSADINNDGHEELILITQNGVYEVDHKFKKATKIYGNNVKQVLFFDIDGDRKKESLVLNYDNSFIIFKDISINIFDRRFMNKVYHFTVSDIDNDGTYEILLLERSSNGTNMHIIKNNNLVGTLEFNENIIQLIKNSTTSDLIAVIKQNGSTMLARIDIKNQEITPISGISTEIRQIIFHRHYLIVLEEKFLKIISFEEILRYEALQNIGVALRTLLDKQITAISKGVKKEKAREITSLLNRIDGQIKEINSLFDKIARERNFEQIPSLRQNVITLIHDINNIKDNMQFANENIKKELDSYIAKLKTIEKALERLSNKETSNAELEKIKKDFTEQDSRAYSIISGTPI